MKTLREMAEEMRRSADVIEQKASADQSGYLHEAAKGNRRIAESQTRSTLVTRLANALLLRGTC